MLVAHAHRHLQTGPTLSPATAKALLAKFAPPPPPHDSASSSSDSPDSLYSLNSDTLPDQTFEFGPAAEVVSLHDEGGIRVAHGGDEWVGLACMVAVA